MATNDGNDALRARPAFAHLLQSFAGPLVQPPPQPSALTPIVPGVLPGRPRFAHLFQSFGAPLASTPTPAAPMRPVTPVILPGPSPLARTFQSFAMPALTVGSFPGYGPAGAATFILSLEPGTRVTLAWGTEIIKSYSGREQRINTSGPRPKQRSGGNAFLLDGPGRDLRSSLQRSAAQGSTFLLALPYEELNITAASVAQTVTVASTALSDWAIVTQRVIVVDTNDVATPAVIQAVTSTQIRLDITPGASTGARIMPLIQVLLEPQQGFSRYAVNVELWSIRATANTFGWVGQDVMGQGAQIRTYGSGLVAASSLTDSDALIFDRPNALSGTAAESMLSLAELVDFGGVPFAAGPALAPDWARPIRYVSADAADWQWFKAFARQLRGRQRAFLLSTNHADLLYVSAVSSTLKVQSQAVSGAGDYTAWYASVAHRLLALTKVDGSIQYVGVGALTDNHDGTLSLGLDAVVTGTVSKISFLETVRIDNGGSDDIPVTWDGGLFTVDLVARTVEEAVVTPTALPTATQIFGQGDSNGVGQDISPDEFDETFDPGTEIAEVPWRMRYAQSVGDGVSNPPYLTDITTGGVRPYNTSGVENSGWRQAFAQEAKRAGAAWSLAEFEVSGIKALQSTPAANVPSAGPNFWTQAMSWHDAAETAFGATTKGTVHFIGGNDGFDSGEASAATANLTAIVNGWIAKKGSGIKLALVRQPDFQGIASTVPFLTTIQAADDAVAAAFPGNVILIPTADMKGHSDHLHLDGDSSVIVGQRIFWGLFDALGGTRPRPAVPQIVGWGPQYMSTGAYSPIPPGCGIAGDLEILIAITQSAGGSSTRISTPTVAGGGTAWTALNDAVLGDTQIQSSQTTTSRLGLWARAVTANRATTSTPLTTVPSNGLTINGGRIITVRGLNALTTSNVGFTRYSKNDAFQATMTLLGGSIAGGVIAIAGGYRTNASSNPVTMSGGSVTGLARAFGGNRSIGSDFITNAGWNAAAASATGNLAVAYTLATLGVGAMVGVTP